jgi:hypothetical protein
MNEHRFPDNFLQTLSAENGFDKENFIKAHQIADAPTSIRLNPFKRPSQKQMNK